MSLEKKLEVKRFGADKLKDILIQQKEKYQNLSFSVAWFQQKDWLTAG